MPEVPHASCGPPGVVQPHVRALVEGAGHGDVVVVDEHEPVADLGVGRELHDLADHLLARLVGRVRLAGEHELHRPLAVSSSASSRSGCDSSSVARL